MKIPEKTILKHCHDTLLKLGVRIWRNNSGAMKIGSRFVKYGVANPGGSDLIGYKVLEITPEMVGKKIAQFVAVECKASQGGKLSEHQRKFLLNVQEDGGIAIVASSVDDVLKIKNP